MKAIKHLLLLVLTAPVASCVWVAGLWIVKLAFLRDNLNHAPKDFTRDALLGYAAAGLSSLLFASNWRTSHTFLSDVGLAAGHGLLASALFGTFREPMGGTIVGLLGGVLFLPLLVLGGFWHLHLYRRLARRFGLIPSPPTSPERKLGG